MTIIDDGTQTDPPSGRSRPWWFAPALFGIALGAFVGAALPPSPGSPSEVVVAATAPIVFAQGSAQPKPTRPSDLPMLPQERLIIDRLTAIGVTAESLGRSHFERDLGPALEARVFNLPEYGGADVLFLDTPRDIRVCATASTTGRLVYKIYVGGQETSSNDAGQYVAYLVSSQFFVIAWDERAASMFQQGFDMTRAPC